MCNGMDDGNKQDLCVPSLFSICLVDKVPSVHVKTSKQFKLLTNQFESSQAFNKIMNTEKTGKATRLKVLPKEM